MSPVTSVLSPPLSTDPFAAALAGRLDPPPPRIPERQWGTPGELARAVDPSTVQTPALDLIDEALVWAYSTPGARLIVSIGPQEGKSTRISKVGVLWALIRNPETRIGIVSYAQPLAESFGREIRNWITTFNGDDGALDLGLRIAPDYGSAKRWQLAGHRGGVLCAGLQGGISGRPLDTLLIDDPFADRKQADSAYYRELVWEWWRSVGSRRLSPDGPVIQVATRWHEDDLAGRMLAAEDGHRWRLVNIPALADHDPAKGQSDPLGREPGQWLRSARGRTDAQWEQIRIESGSRNFAALYQGRPSPDAGNVWKRPWWRRYREPLWSQHPQVPGAYLVRDVDELVMSWDMTFKDTKGSDFVAGGLLARRGADVFLLDVIRKRLSFPDTLTAFAAFCARWPGATAKYVEDKANGPAVISTLRSKIPGIVAVNPKDSKYGRATAVAPFVEAGNVLVPDAEIALFDPEELISEAAAFPNGSHDDLVDMMSQGLAELLLDGTGAQAWIEWARKKALAAQGTAPEAGAPEPEPEPEPEPDPEPGVPLTPEQARKQARDEMYRQQRERAASWQR
ncbi:MAG TPA: phage terminase large subunit [Streptosporangiaceae bacterium]|nr:phage terminase large subunit [Streptosporangiaceae bacterium]